jgi:hypothetical protein
VLHFQSDVRVPQVRFDHPGRHGDGHVMPVTRLKPEPPSDWHTVTVTGTQAGSLSASEGHHDHFPPGPQASNPAGAIMMPVGPTAVTPGRGRDTSGGQSRGP